MHGHAHKINRLELGYLITSQNLFSRGDKFNKYDQNSSLNGLVKEKDFEALLRGPESLGTLLFKEGFPSVPSSIMLDPGKGNKYFSGGYNTVRHGARNSKNCYAIQIEMHKPGVRDTEEHRKKFAAALERSLTTFYKRFLKR